VLLVRPEVLDRFQCTDDVTPTKPPFDFSNATSHEKHHLKVLSLKNLGKGLSVTGSWAALTYGCYGSTNCISDSVRFFNKNRGFGSVQFLVTYLPFLGILNRESTNAVNGNINLGYTYIPKLLW